MHASLLLNNSSLTDSIRPFVFFFFSSHVVSCVRDARIFEAEVFVGPLARVAKLLVAGDHKTAPLVVAPEQNQGWVIFSINLMQIGPGMIYILALAIPLALKM